MDPNLSDQNLPPKPTSSVGNVVPPVTPQDQVSSQQPQPVVFPEPIVPPSSTSSAPPVSVSEPLVSSVSPASETPPVVSEKSGNDSEEFYPKGPKINRKIALGVFILLMLVTIPATVFVARQPQTTQSDAANELTPETVIAVINGENILEKDLEKVVSEQYDT